MDKSPLISIITVTFNAADVIGKTLDSLGCQSFKDFEHLVIDGKSNDETLLLVENAALPLTTIVCEPDKGLYDAMNKGLKLAKGKYILFLNAGDKFHSNLSLENYAKWAQKDSDIIYGDTVIVNTRGDIIANRHLSVPERLDKKSFASGMLICHQAFMVKKSLVPEYDLSYRFSADYDWCVKCIETSESEKCINLKEVTIDFLSDGLTDKNKWKSLRERFLIMSRHYGFLPTLFRHIGFVFRAIRRGKI